jgi:hypothetical protein
MAKLKIQARIGDGSVTTIRGRDAETLVALVDAGAKGITSLETFKAGWAVRLAAYVHDLKRLGVPIVAIREPHDGGSHARYRLAGDVEIITRSDATKGIAA